MGCRLQWFRQRVQLALHYLRHKAWVGALAMFYLYNEAVVRLCFENSNKVLPGHVILSRGFLTLSLTVVREQDTA